MERIASGRRMTSIGCFSDSLRFCLCDASHVDQSLSGARSVRCSAAISRPNCSLADGNQHFRPVNRSWRNKEGGILSVGGLSTSKSSAKRTVRASRSELNAEATEGKTAPKQFEPSTTGESALSHLDLLERFTAESSLSTGGRTIAEQLEGQIDAEEGEVVTVPLGQSTSLETSPLTISQKRNIRRQKYLNEVSKRNDAPFFTSVALFVIVPPAVILGVAVATGYIELFP